MKKHIFLAGAFLLLSFQLFAQTPVYLTKAYKPVESELYDVYSSHEIQGGDTWNNCFVLSVINNYCGRAVFNLGGKYETSFQYSSYSSKFNISYAEPEHRESLCSGRYCYSFTLTLVKK